MKRTIILLSILTLPLTMPETTYAMDMSSMEMDSSADAHPTAIEAVGVVDEIDQAKGVVTISHEAIKSLDWPAMTMNFTIKDKKMFGKLSTGKKIHFAFIQQKGKYVVTEVK